MQEKQQLFVTTDVASAAIRKTIYVGLGLMAEGIGRVRLDLQLYGTTTNASDPQAEQGTLPPGAVAYHTSAVVVGDMSDESAGKLMSLALRDIRRTLEYRIQRLLGEEGSSTMTFRQIVPGAAPLTQATPVSGEPTGLQISEDYLIEIGQELRRTLVAERDGHIHRHLTAAQQVDEMPAPRRIPITPAFRDKLIAEGRMPLPKNLQPRNGEHYCPHTSRWIKD